MISLNNSHFLLPQILYLYLSIFSNNAYKVKVYFRNELTLN